jgi:hypothetical protein
LYGPTLLDAFMPTELAGSLWLYHHAPPGSVLVLAADNFPTREVPDYYLTQVRAIPADPQNGRVWLSEANVPKVQAWMASLRSQDIYVVFSSNMATYANYFGAPYGYAELAHAARNRPGWSLIYHNAGTTIYHVHIGLGSASGPPIKIGVSVPRHRVLARYTVDAGDSLVGIAAAFGVRGGWSALYAANRHLIGAVPGLIRPGTVLMIPRSTAPVIPRSTASAEGSRATRA